MKIENHDFWVGTLFIKTYSRHPLKTTLMGKAKLNRYQFAPQSTKNLSFDYKNLNYG
tara:strand:+ start:240 stop:410 length:171 start_codon:yes stop_codon:yes gene_type:complete